MKKTIMQEAAVSFPNLILPPYDAILNQDGFDAICAFSEYFGGTTVYVPSTRTIFASCLLAQAKNDYDTKNVSLVALARKYGFSERYLRKVI